MNTEISDLEADSKMEKYEFLCIWKVEKTKGLWWPNIAHLNHSIANRDAVRKVMVTLTMTFALRVIFWLEETSLRRLIVLPDALPSYKLVLY